jgi:predicted dinucleotide-binding enzyme
MRIGVIGAGNMGTAMGTIWAAKGHQILFSFTNDSMRLQKAMVAAGVNGRIGTPAEAVRVRRGGAARGALGGGRRGVEGGGSAQKQGSV